MWSSILLAGACGALAALIAGLIVRDPKNKPGRYAIILALLFIVLTSAGRTYILPEIRAWEARREASKFLEQNRIFSLLALRHPEIREQVTTMLVGLARRGASAEEARAEGEAWGRKLVGPYFEQYAPRASGESLVRFLLVTVNILEQLGAREDHACYYWLFGGQAPPGLFLSATIPQGDQMRMLEAMADVVESSISDPQGPPDPKRAEALIKALIARLVARHGQDFLASLALLEQPTAPNVDRKAVCHATTELYRAALASPKGERELLIRSLFNAEVS